MWNILHASDIGYSCRISFLSNLVIKWLQLYLWFCMRTYVFADSATDGSTEYGWTASTAAAATDGWRRRWRSQFKLGRLSTDCWQHDVYQPVAMIGVNIVAS